MFSATSVFYAERGHLTNKQIMDSDPAKPFGQTNISYLDSYLLHITYCLLITHGLPIGYP